MAPPRCLRLLIFFLLCCCPSPTATRAGDAAALLALKSAVDPLGSLPWRRGSEGGMCSGWDGVKGCTAGGRVTKLVAEATNLTGALTAALLSPLDQLRVLSFKSNSLSGGIPDMSALANLKSLYLIGNEFSGEIPPSLAALRRLRVLDLSDNLLTGRIPAALAALPRLSSLLLRNNSLSGPVPPLRQPGLRFLDISGNELSGEIPDTPALSRFNSSSFSGNPNLCGPQAHRPCPQNNLILTPAPAPAISPGSRRKKRVIVAVAVAAAAAGGLVAVVALSFFLFLKRRRKKNRVAGNQPRGGGGGGEGEGKAVGEEGASGGEGEEEGRLVFLGGGGGVYGMEDLLRASAETLGRGAVGSTYKAVMESGYIVTVKRLRDAPAPPPSAEFRRRAEELGALRHANIVPLRAYLQAREERLLVYDYFPNGSLFSLIHGSRASGFGRPLHWTSCMKIAEDVAAGLVYLHHSSPAAVHGNLKSSNVLLGPDFESCLADCGLSPTFLHHPHDDPAVPSFTPESDMQSFGALLLEMLTGKTPPLPHGVLEDENGVRRWMGSMVRGDENDGGPATEEKMNALVGIAAACLGRRPPGSREVLRMVREARAEALVSSKSNSSDHSPGRWSDAVQSLPREHGSDHSIFAERD